MATKVCKCGIKRQKGYLYYIDKRGNVSFIKTKNNTVLYFIKGEPDYVGEFVHFIRLGKDNVRTAVCLGGIDGGGKDPDSCPICAEHKIHLEEFFRLDKLAKKKGKKSIKRKAKDEQTIANALQAKKNVLMRAIEGELTIGKKTSIEWDDNIGIVNLSSAQWEKIESVIWKKFSKIMRSEKDLFNRGIIVKKKKKKGKSGNSYSEVYFEPLEKREDVPDAENEDEEIKLEDAFNFLSEKEMKRLLKKYLRSIGEDNDDDDEEDDVEEDEDYENEEPDNDDDESEDDDEEDDEEEEEEEEDKEFEEDEDDDEPEKKKKKKKNKFDEPLDDDDKPEFDDDEEEEGEEEEEEEEEEDDDEEEEEPKKSKSKKSKKSKSKKSKKEKVKKSSKKEKKSKKKGKKSSEKKSSKDIDDDEI